MHAFNRCGPWEKFFHSQVVRDPKKVRDHYARGVKKGLSVWSLRFTPERNGGSRLIGN